MQSTYEQLFKCLFQERRSFMTDHDIEICDEQCVHTDAVQAVHSHMPDDDILYDVAELFKVFGDSTRIRILSALSDDSICVCDLAEALGMTQSAVSHQLRILKQAKLVSARREGKSVIYSLSDDHVRTIIRQGIEHITE